VTRGVIRGSTEKTLKIRINEHRNYINRNIDQRSVITEHRLKKAHDFDNVKILDKKKY